MNEPQTLSYVPPRDGVHTEPGVIRLSEFRYADATAIAVVMLVASFLIIFAVNRLQRWAQTRLPAH